MTTKHDRRRRSTVLALGAVAVGLLAACQPIRVDTDTETTTSNAQYRVISVDTSHGPGIEIRFRDCDTVEFTGSMFPNGVTAHLRPVAYVTDATGKVIFFNPGPIGATVPPGSKVIDSTGSGDTLQRIIVPVAGAKAPITIEPTCTSYPGYGQGGGYTWSFTDHCTTSDRTCATRTGGRGTFNPGT